MKRVICSPGSYLQGQGELSRLAEYYQTLGRQGAYLIVSRSAYAFGKIVSTAVPLRRGSL